MLLDFKTYSDKVAGCWVGKNIGGVLGTPFEGRRQFNNEVTFYVQDLEKEQPANDDLDLQIVWLAAVERYGRNVNASILGEYWLNFVLPNWVEYGTGKANLRAGLVPPMCGAVDNQYKNSCGCYIRSEIWACLAPGNPALAAKYAYEDAIVDHAEDGMQAEIFCAALESAAFVESDPYKLIDIALSYIDKNSTFAKAILAAVNAKKNGLSFREATIQIHNAAPGTFGVQNCTRAEAAERTKEMGFAEVGESGMDAAENCGFFVAAWLYGKDFEEALLLSNSAGEDTDCTCATLGALLGIINGESGLPEKWKAPLGDKIITMCIDQTWQGIWIPNTCKELSERVLRVTPGFLGAELCDVTNSGGYTIACQEDLYCGKTDDYLYRTNSSGKDWRPTTRTLCELGSNVIHNEYPSFDVLVDLMDEPYFTYGEDRSIGVKVINNQTMRRQEWVRITLYTPEGVQLRSARQYVLPINLLWGACAEAKFTVNADEFTGGKLELLVDVQVEGKHSYGVTKVVLMRR